MLNNMVNNVANKLKELFYEYWAAATLVIVFVAWCVAVYSKMSV